MIADATFGPARDGARPLRFVPRSSIPLAAACLVANGAREALRELAGDPCEVLVGEPAVLEPGAWEALVRGALLFAVRGRQTDVVLVIAERDARRLVTAAFAEDERGDEAISPIELRALERVLDRCVAALDAVCAERGGTLRAVDAAAAPRCVGYVDLRARGAVALTMGIGISRELPDPGASGRLARGALDDVAIPLRAVLARVAVPARALATLRVGDELALAAGLDDAASLEAGGVAVARGVAGAAAGRAALEVVS